MTEQQSFVPDSGPSAPRPGWHAKQMNLPQVVFRLVDGGFGHRFFWEGHNRA